MAVQVVRKHAHQHALARLAVVVRLVVGGVLVGIGVLVGPVGIVVGAGYAADGASRLTGASQPGDPGVWDDLPWPSSTLLLVTAVAIALLVLGLGVGLRLLRGGRSTVLFLRRFRDAEAIGALSFAAAGAVGSSWRVVTLDDGEIASLGVAAGTRRFFGGLKGAYTVLVVAGTKLAPIGAGLFTAAAAGVVGLRYLQTGEWDLDLVTRNLPDERALFGVIPVPPQPLGLNLETAFYLLIAGGITLVGAGFAAFAAMLALMVLAGPAILASAAAGAVQESEAGQRAKVSGADDVDRVTSAVVTASRRVFAPRLVVLTVDPAWWRQSVRALAGVAVATVVDVSEPSENVLWEVEHLRAERSRVVLVGHLGELGTLIEGGRAPAADPGDQTVPVAYRLAQALDGEEVLAYTLTWWGRRRFVRALRATLLCPADASRDVADRANVTTGRI